jgi:hypothetical protein
MEPEVRRTRARRRTKGRPSATFVTGLIAQSAGIVAGAPSVLSESLRVPASLFAKSLCFFAGTLGLFERSLDVFT